MSTTTMHRKSSRRIFIFLLTALTTLSLWPVVEARRSTDPPPPSSSAAPARSSFFCACCVPEGTWYERSARMGEYESSQIARLKFSAKAETYMTEAGAEMVKGVAPPVGSDYALAASRKGRRWELSFKDDQGRAGTLALEATPVAVSFGADTHEAGGNGAVLYKEMRLKGRVASGTGIFQKGVTATTAFRLILQGRGNGCLNAEDFSHWTLQISGPKASYSFHGSFAKPG